MKKSIILLMAAGLLFACTPQPAAQNDNPGNTDQPGGNDNPGGDDVNPGGDDTFAPEAWYETNYWERTDREKMGLRGKVKKWYFNTKQHTEYEFDEAGHLILERQVNPEGRFGDWLTIRTYDAQGRLIKEQYGRTGEKGGMELDPSSGAIEECVYEYNNPGKYVWVMTNSDFDSRNFVNFLGPEYRERVTSIMKDLSSAKLTTSYVGYTSKGHLDITHIFDESGNLTLHTHIYARAYDVETDTEGDILPEEEYESDADPIVYQGAYPYSGTINNYYTITSMTWRENGMPLTVDGPSGLTEYSATEKRYINPVKWTCKEGAPLDALFGFVYWREWSYDDKGELLKLDERMNEGSENAWTRPTTYEYTYDAHGNWTSFTSHYQVLIDGPDGEVKTGHLERVIEYY
ncbi:MAG: hypothetical protein J5669_07520 [Bacteroidales bacterium]|nr:hypothetical protein [Bacteroidales bacterium]